MQKDIYCVRMFDEDLFLRADFSEASSNIEYGSLGLTHDEIDWSSTQWQVANFTHDVEGALRAMLETMVRECGDEPEDFHDEIEKAIGNYREIND